MTCQSVTENRPAELEATFRWEGDGPVRTGDPLLSPVTSHDPSPGLSLVDDHVPDRYHDTSRPECWRIDDPAGPAGGLGMPVNDLDPGEGASVELQVWTEYGLDGCLPTGTYRFEETVSVTPRPGDDAASVPVEGGLVDIEFTLRVASP